MACALFMLTALACPAAKNTMTEGLKAARFAPCGSFCPARQAGFAAAWA
jgi:hypothetical protein